MKTKTKAIIISAVCIILIAAYFTRFAYLNITAEKPQIKIYNQNEFVEYDNNFFYRNTENRNGYSVKVLSAKLLPIKDYLKTINLTYDDYCKMYSEHEHLIKDYILDVNIIIKNTGNTEGNFDRLDTRVNAANYCFQCDDELFSFIYPYLADSFSFKVRENTEYEMHIPFSLIPADEAVLSFDDIKNDDLHLNISQYPIKKMIKLDIVT